MSKVNMTSWADNCSSSSEDEEETVHVVVEEKEEFVDEKDDVGEDKESSNKNKGDITVEYRAFIRHLDPHVQDQELRMELEQIARDQFGSIIKCTCIKLMRPKATQHYQQPNYNFNYVNGYIHVETYEQLQTLLDMNQKVELSCNNKRRLDIEVARYEKRPTSSVAQQSRRTHDRGSYTSTNATDGSATDGRSFRGGIYYRNRSVGGDNASPAATTNNSSFSKSTNAYRRGNERLSNALSPLEGSNSKDPASTSSTTDQQQEVKRERPKLMLLKRSKPIEEIKVIPVMHPPSNANSNVSDIAAVNKEPRVITPAATTTPISGDNLIITTPAPDINTSVEPIEPTAVTSSQTVDEQPFIVERNKKNKEDRFYKKLDPKLHKSSPISATQYQQQQQHTPPVSSNDAPTLEDSFFLERKKKNKEERFQKRENPKPYKPSATSGTQYQQQQQQQQNRRKPFKDKKTLKDKQQHQNDDASKQDEAWKDPKKVLLPSGANITQSKTVNQPVSSTNNAFAALALDDDDDDDDDNNSD